MATTQVSLDIVLEKEGIAALREVMEYLAEESRLAISECDQNRLQKLERIADRLDFAIQHLQVKPRR